MNALLLRHTAQSSIHLNKIGFVSLLYIGITLLCSVPVFAQKPLSYPTGYFMFPIKPNQTNFLSGNMGELRSNHFHGGLDIKTEGREGLPIYAAADGYVSRIKVMTAGYGNALYITHPNGYVSVYGHLKTYNKVIGGFLRQQQYNSKTWEIDVLPDKSLIPVKKGEIVAYSGNTGGSGGPHLHFEIRDTLDNLLNPLYFGFTEIKDHTPPTVTKLAIRTLNSEARIENGLGRAEYTPQKISSKQYKIMGPIEVWGEIGLELQAFDMSDGTSNKNGVTCVEVRLDGKEVYSHQLETLAFDVNRHINVHIDYEFAQLKSTRFERLYIADGNRLGIYKTDAKKGRITIRDNKPRLVTINLIDAHRNSTQLNFTLKGVAPQSTVSPFTQVSQNTLVQSALLENVLKITAKHPKDNQQPAVVFANKKPHTLPIAYLKNNEAVYLWDMRKALPDSVQVQGITQTYNFRKVVPVNQEVLFTQDSLNILFPAKALFDTLYLETNKKGAVFTISKPSIPLQESIDVRITPATVVSPENKIRTGVYAVRGRTLSYKGGIWVDNQLSFKTREFGNFTVATDSVAPVVKLESKMPGKIACKISDNLSGIYNFTATLNGEWLLMQYDYKKNLLWSDPLDSSKPLKGKFVLEVVDNAGNATKMETTL